MEVCLSAPEPWPCAVKGLLDRCAGTGITALRDTARLAGLSMATYYAVRQGWPQLSQLPHLAVTTQQEVISPHLCLSLFRKPGCHEGLYYLLYNILGAKTGPLETTGPHSSLLEN